MWLLLLLSACVAPPPPEEAPSCPSGSLATGEVRVLATGFDHDGTAGTEGLAFSPAGRLFVGGANHGGGGYVAEVFADGSHDVLASVVGSVGLEWWQGGLVVAVGADGAAGPDGGVVRIDPHSGALDTLIEGIPGANFVVPTARDTLLVSAPRGTTIWEVDREGAGSTWASEVVSPNGMVFSPDGGTLYVAQTYETPNIFRAIEVADDGSAGAVHELHEFDAGATQDGVAMDVDGNVYVVLNLPGEIWRITPEGRVEFLASGVDWGASLRFGTGDWDPCSLYVTSLFSDQLFEVGAGRPGYFAP